MTLVNSEILNQNLKAAAPNISQILGPDNYIADFEWSSHWNEVDTTDDYYSAQLAIKVKRMYENYSVRKRPSTLAFQAINTARM